MPSIPLLLLLLLLTGCQESVDPVQQTFSATQLLSNSEIEGFSRADHIRPFRFPEDHAAHPDYRNEWWYFTGNLNDQAGRRFGYQVTFFRFALKPPPATEHPSSWANNQVWMAHVAITDPQEKRHMAEEKRVREGPGLAGTTLNPLKVWVENWQLTESTKGFPWHVQINTQKMGIDLELTPTVGLVLQGDKGLSQKSAASGNASYYYSYPRLKSQGTITLAGTTYQVTGESWFDREWGTSALSSEQTGWDWFSLQFNSGESLMFYHLRDQQGKADTFSGGTWIDSKAKTARLSLDDVELTPVSWWESPAGIRYPTEWKMQLVPENRTLIVRAVLDKQEMDLSVRYWEGAVDVLEQGRTIGRGYLEMTGY
ncbi:MAG: carotenoid 1,2-hydratase [Sedimenticola sp.]|nr:carotenoid 1,2-hydratase [Sedimenticola sp.]